DKDALAANGLSTQSITQLLQSSGVLLPAGQIPEDRATPTVQAGQRLTSTDAIAPLAFPATPRAFQPSFDLETGDATVPTPTVVTIAAVAQVEVVDQAATGYSRVNGRDALTIAVTKTSAGKTVAVSHAVAAALPGLAAAVGGATEF